MMLYCCYDNLVSQKMIMTCRDIIGNYFDIMFKKANKKNIRIIKNYLNNRTVTDFQVGGDVQKVAGQSRCCHIVNMLSFLHV